MVMLKAIGGLFGTSPLIKEKTYDHIKAAIQILEKKPEDPAQYKWARKVAETYQLEKNHPLNQMLQSAQSKERRERVEARNAVAVKTVVELSQKGMPAQDFIACVQTYGASLTSIEVTEGSDELFENIAAYCPSLSTFIFNESATTPSFDLTDEGLVYLTRLPNLAIFEFKAFNLFNVSEKGIEGLLSSSQLSSNLVRLTMHNASFNDACYISLAKYSKLQALSIHTNTLHYKTLSSYPIPSSITSYTLSIGELPRDLVTDEFLNSLPINLTTLSINGSFRNVSAAGFTNAMKRLAKLEHLSLSSTPVEGFMLNAVKQHLKSIHLGDCSQLKASNFAEFFNTQPELVDLSIGNAIQLSRIPFPESLQKLYLHAPKWDDLSLIPTTLKELTLEGIEAVYLDFESFLSRCTQLDALNILNCPWFNRESLEAALRTLGDNLTKIALIGTSVDDIGIVELADFSRLTTVALGNLKAVTKMGIQRFLREDRVAARTRNLYFCDLFISNDMASLFTSFENLRVLFIGNSLAGFPGPKDIFENDTLLKNETQCADWYGPSLYGKFLSEIK